MNIAPRKNPPRPVAVELAERRACPPVTMTARGPPRVAVGDAVGDGHEERRRGIAIRRGELAAMKKLRAGNAIVKLVGAAAWSWNGGAAC